MTGNEHVRISPDFIASEITRSGTVAARLDTGPAPFTPRRSG